MEELYGLIIEFIKVHPIRFWTGLTISILLIAFIICKVIKKSRLKKKQAKQKLAELTKKKIEEERIAKEKTVAEAKLSAIKTAEEKKQKVLETKRNTEKANDAYKSSVVKSEKVNEPETIYETKVKKSEISIPATEVKKREKSIEKLHEAKKETNKAIDENSYVNYKTTILESTENYPVFRCPKKGCIVRTHRFGHTKRRGFKEESFQNTIQKHFGSKFIVSGEVRLNTGKETRPFEPDIAIIDRESKKNIRIDIEIDEPYAGITRQPTHCKGDDLMRDTYFIDRGWIVIRFSEYQVHTLEMECLKHIAIIIKSLDNGYSIPAAFIAIDDLNSEKLWDIVRAQKWEKEKYREKYLNHTFIEIPVEKETIERDFNEQELNEEKLVKPSLIGTLDNVRNIGFNLQNVHPRDKRIKFYPEPHIYTIDNVPAPSASTIVSKFFPKFDSYGKAINLSSSNPLFGLPVEEIVQIWNNRGLEAANQGTFLHEQIEKYYLKQPFSKTEEFHLFEQFVQDHSEFEPYRSEWGIFDNRYHIAGTIDLIVKNGNGFDIYDWKRSKKVVDTFSGSPIKIDTWGNCGVGNLSSIDDTSYNRYCLQQSLYRYILENNYELKISKMYLVVLYPDYDQYYKVETPYQKENIEYILGTL